MAKALTTKSIEAIKPDPVRRVEIRDPAVAGLFLVVQSSGVKSWAVRYRFGGRPTKFTLGRWPGMGLAQARTAAAEALGRIERGSDPAEEKKVTKAVKLEAQLSERDRIKTLVEQYDKRHLANLRSGAVVRRELDRHVVAIWGDRNIHDITKRDVIDLLDAIADSGRVITANRIRAYLNKFFNWAVERDVLQTNPATGVKPAAKEVSRDRVLSDDEIRWFWRACDLQGFPWGELGKVLLLTGQRLGEVAQMSDAEIKGALWRLPAARTKNGRAHDVPLSEAVRSILARMVSIKSDGGYIFTTTGKTAVSGFHKARQNLDRAMAKVASEERGEVVNIARWTFHDLRRTAATGMARLGVAVRVTEAILNHVSGTGGGIVAVYQRHDYADEKRQALEAWARFVVQIVDGSDNNVVRISEARA